MRKGKRNIIISLLMVFVLAFGTVTAFPISQEVQAASKVKLNKSKVTIKAGKTYKLKVVNGKAKKNSWKSSNKKVATVSKTGKVTGKKKGTATISVKVGKKTLKCKVTVKAKAKAKDKVKDNGSEICVKTGKPHAWAMWDITTSTQYFAYQCQDCYPVGDTKGKAYALPYESPEHDGIINALGLMNKHQSDVHGRFGRSNIVEYGVKCVCVDCGTERVWSDGIVKKECNITIGRNTQIFDFILKDWSGYKDVKVTSSNSNIVKISRGEKRTPIYDDNYMPCYIITPTGNEGDTATITIKSNGKTVETITLHLINHW